MLIQLQAADFGTAKGKGAAAAAGGMEVSLGGGGAAAAAASAGESLLPTLEGLESLQSEVPLDPMAGEQTW